MSLSNKLEAIRSAAKTVEVDTKKLGKVTLIELFTSHRLLFYRDEYKNKDASLLTIALSLCENKRRLCDSIGVNEVMEMIDPLGSSNEGLEDIRVLYDAARKLSLVSDADVEDAGKN